MNNFGYPYSFRIPGLILGFIIIIFTASLFSVEIGRLYKGSFNYGRNASNVTFQFLLYPDTIIGYNGDKSNIKPENHYLWPWSTPTLLFSLVFFLTGAIGIIGGQRESYISILTFFIWSLISSCLIIFLIASYSTTIAGWKSIYDTNDDNSIPDVVKTDKKFSNACLALSCVLFLIFILSLVLAGKSIDVCKRKAYPRSNRYGYLPKQDTPRSNHRAFTPTFGRFN